MLTGAVALRRMVVRPAKLKGEIETFIRESRQPGKCILFSTHIMEEAEYMCDRLAIINGAIGTMDELRAQTGRQRLRDVFLSLLGLAEPLKRAVGA